MPATTIKSGRPCFIAELDFENDGGLEELRYRFFEVCDTFHYREIMSLSRALGVHPGTVQNWKYKQTFPDIQIVAQIIDWDKKGRPMKKIPPWQGAAEMY